MSRGAAKMLEKWNPPRGAVTISPTTFHDGATGLTAGCSACGWTYANVVKSDVEYQKRNHRCPQGTAAAYPTCTACGSRSSRCKRPSGHDATEWHAARVADYQQHVV